MLWLPLDVCGASCEAGGGYLNQSRDHSLVGRARRIHSLAGSLRTAAEEGHRIQNIEVVVGAHILAA